MQTGLIAFPFPAIQSAFLYVVQYTKDVNILPCLTSAEFYLKDKKTMPVAASLICNDVFIELAELGNEPLGVRFPKPEFL